MSPTTFLILQILIPAFGVAAGLAVLRRAARKKGRIAVFDVLWAGVWTCCGAGAATIFAAPLGLSPFGVIRMIYLAGVVAVPAVGVGLVAARALGRTTLTPAAAVLTACGLLGAPLGAYMSFVEPYDLRVETATVTLPPARSGSEPIRVGILADLQCDSVGEHEIAAVDALLAQKPDLILVPGDLFQSQLDRATEYGACRDELLELLARVRAPYGVYFVIGDVDSSDIVRDLRERTGWTILVDENVRVRVHDRDVSIAGTTRAGAIRVGTELEVEPGDGDVRILMSHAPDTILGLEGTPRADLIVAGHTHGGQVVVPGFGPPMTLSRVPRDMAAGGLHTFGGRAIYVSRGAGLERNQAPPMRLLCPPEVSVVTLRRAVPDQP